MCGATFAGQDHSQHAHCGDGSQSGKEAWRRVPQVMVHIWGSANQVQPNATNAYLKSYQFICSQLSFSTTICHGLYEYVQDKCV